MAEELDSITLEGILVPTGEPVANPKHTEPVPGRGQSVAALGGVELTLPDGLEPKKEFFVKAYARTGTLTAAAKLVGISPSTHRKWLADDPLYREAFEAAFDAITDALEEVSLIASLDPANSRERQFQLRARRPDRYNQSNVKVGGEVKHVHSLVDLVKQAHKDGSLEGEYEA